jgi:hypothetical protein
MIEIKRSHLIAATAAPLAVVLVAVALVVTRGPSPVPPKAVAEAPAEPEKTIATHDKRTSLKPAKSVGAKALAVSADGFDLMTTNLDELGAGYGYDTIDDEALLDLASLRRYEVVFLTCADVGEPVAGLPKVLHDYVSGGGTLYASDLRYEALATAFPDVVDPASVAQGVPQDLQCEVNSPELRDLLGPSIKLQFKSERWRTAAFRGDDVSVLLKGSLKTTAGVAIEAPLAVRFTIGKGTVIFTSFHREGKVSSTEAKLLKFLALKAVTSATEVRVTESLADGGFATKAIASAGTDAGSPAASHDYLHEKPGPIKFRLDSARPGASLRLEVVDPSGKTTTKRGESTLAIDVTDAAAGRWQFRALAETAPYPAFPAVVAVATSAASAESTSARMNPALVATGGNVHFEVVDLGNKTVVKRTRPLQIAVTRPRFDDMGKLLVALGDGYRFKQLDDEALRKPEALDPFDVLFLTCGGWPVSWGKSTNDKEFRPGLSSGEMSLESMGLISRTLNRFVERGGTLYASDLRYEFLGYAFLDRIPGPDLDTNRLPEVEKAEKTWLKVVAPLAKVGTVSQTLDGLKLSDKLLAHRDELLAAINTSALIKMEGEASADDDLKAITREASIYGLPATAADCAAIAEAFGNRRTAILGSLLARSKTKVKKTSKEIVFADKFLAELRGRLIIDYSGAKRQYVDAQVVDSGLQEAIGGTIRLLFPDNAWDPGRFVGQDVQVLIRGTYISMNREQIEAPLLARFRQGKGTVIFTAFHNEAQNSQQELQLLRYLVFSAVTAKEEALTQETMLSGGFSPVKQSQVNHAAGMDSITKKYQSASGDPLRFSLNFGGGGAKLRLTLVAPGGEKREFETDETILVEATGAPAGEWLYTVTAVKVPYQNYAYSVSIGTRTSPSPGRG